MNTRGTTKAVPVAERKTLVMPAGTVPFQSGPTSK